MAYYRSVFWRSRSYLDYASATPVDPRVARAVSQAIRDFPGNPSAPHEEGRKARAAVSAAREAIARSLSVKADELLFTSGGTEANNIAIHGFIQALEARGAERAKLHIITSTIEHSSVIKTVEALERSGVSVSYIDPEEDGIVSAEKVADAFTPHTALVTLAHVNSEIGTIQPIADLSERAMIYHSKHHTSGKTALARLAPETIFPVIHADAAQSPLYLDASPHALKASLVSYDAQKIGGPKGTGVLYRDFSVALAPLYGGGVQERSLRPGTENVSGIVGAGVAFPLAKEGRRERAERIALLRDYLVSCVEKEIPAARFTGSRKHRIANNAHFVIPGANGDYLTVLLDSEGVAVSPRSACIGSAEGFSHVVFALTKDEQTAKETIRFSLGPETTRRDCGRAVAALRKSLAVIRQAQ